MIAAHVCYFQSSLVFAENRTDTNGIKRRVILFPERA